MECVQDRLLYLKSRLVKVTVHRVSCYGDQTGVARLGKQKRII